MLAILFTTLIVSALVFSSSTIIGTWLRYASAWDALTAQAARPAHRRYLTVSVIDQRPARFMGYNQTITAARLQTASLAFAQRREWRAAA